MSLVKSSDLGSNSEFVVRCAFPNCKSRIIGSSGLPAELVTLTNTPHMLRLSKSSTDGVASDARQFYRVEDVWAFDNIGVSRKIPEDQQDITVDGQVISVQRLLICSDCDRGPIGFAGLLKGQDAEKTDNLIYFLNNDSILYEIKT